MFDFCHVALKIILSERHESLCFFLYLSLFPLQKINTCKMVSSVFFLGEIATIRFSKRIYIKY